MYHKCYEETKDGESTSNSPHSQRVDHLGRISLSLWIAPYGPFFRLEAPQHCPQNFPTSQGRVPKKKPVNKSPGTRKHHRKSHEIPQMFNKNFTQEVPSINLPGKFLTKDREVPQKNSTLKKELPARSARPG